jgi:ankyrin repeat protein
LMLACDKGQLEIAKVLIECKANLNLVDMHGFTALIYAAERGQLEIVQMLVNAKVNVDAQHQVRESTFFLFLSFFFYQ